MNHNLEIRKIIKEEVAKLLDEDYESVSELRQFANDILLELARENVDFFVERVKNEKPLDFFYSISIVEAYQNSKHKYKKINEFLRLSNNTRIALYKTDNERSRGVYKHNKTASGYNLGERREIILYYEDSFIEDLKKKILDWIERGYENTYYELYSPFYYKFTSTLIHELQHNYDDFRSKGNTFNTKQSKSFSELANALKQKQTTEELTDKEEFAKYDKYLNLPHEIWARFSQSVFKIRFTKGEVFKTEDEKVFLKRTMYPISDAVSSLKMEFVGWEKLSDKMKKKLLNKIVQFWHLEEEKIKKENANPEYFS